MLAKAPAETNTKKKDNTLGTHYNPIVVDLGKLPASSGSPYKNKAEELKAQSSKLPKTLSSPKVVHSDGTQESMTSWLRYASHHPGDRKTAENYGLVWLF